MMLFYEDETHIHDYQALHITWFLFGKQKQIPTYGYHASVTLFSAVNMLNCIVWKLLLVMRLPFRSFYTML